MELSHKKRFWFPGLLTAILLLVFLTFPGGITLDFSTANRAHLYEIFFYEIICAFLWIWIFCRILPNLRNIENPIRAAFWLAVLFGAYYFALETARFFLGGNIQESIMLFRNILLLFSVFFCLVLTKWDFLRIVKITVSFFVFLTVGYINAVIRARSFVVHFPDVYVVFCSLVCSLVPLLLYIISNQWDSISRIWRVLILALLLTNSVLIFCGTSRAATVLLLFVWLVWLIAFIPKSGQAPRIALIVEIILIATVCLLIRHVDLFSERDNTDRVLMLFLPSVDVDIDSGKEKDEIILKPSTSTIPYYKDKETVVEEARQYMEEREKLRGTGNDHGVLFDNPTAMSDNLRAYLFYESIERLQGDWLFSIKGLTVIPSDFSGVIQISGAHNLILDYLLAFGIVGTTVLAAMIAAPIFFVLKAFVKKKRWKELFSFLLSLISLFGIAMVQSVLSCVLPLSWLFVLVSLWYKNEQEDNNSFSTTQRICMLVSSGVVNDSRVQREATAAAQNGFDVYVLGRYEEKLGKADPNLPFSCELIPIPHAEGSVRDKIKERLRFGRALAAQTICFRPDIVHCNDFDTLPFGYFAAAVCGSAVVYDSHEIWSEYELVTEHPQAKKLVKRIEGYLARRCDGVISVSNAAGAWLKETYGLNNLVVVTNCPATGAVERLPKHPGFELLCHGTLGPNRGYEEIIGCAKLVAPDGIHVNLRVFGDLLEHYKALARDSGADNIVFSEKVAPPQVPTAASASHVGVVLTRPVNKGFELTVSNKIFEYIAAGLPVIMSDVPEHRYLNDKYRFGIILPEITAEVLAEAAIRLKNDAALYKVLARNAERASREMCFEKESKKLIELYRNCTKQSLQEGNGALIQRAL